MGSDTKREDLAFDARFRDCRDELKWLFMELYDDAEAFDYFCGMLLRSYQQRKAALRELDRRRAAEPGWYRSNGLLGMMLYVSAFAGTLRGVEEKLPYLGECGVNYLHLMPLLDSPKGKSDGGYAVSDFRKVRPDLGTMEDLEALADACRYCCVWISCSITPVRSTPGPRPPGPAILWPAAATSSTMTGRSPISLSAPCPRSSPPPPRGIIRIFPTAARS